MSGVEIPRLRIPLKVGANGSLDVVEQDGETDIGQCVRSILRHRIGDRVDLPDMGVLDPTFSEHVDVGALVEIVDRHEPRVSVTATSTVSAVEAALTEINVAWQGTTTPEGSDG